jgi:magnesium-transporting ATPase (P-type)
MIDALHRRGRFVAMTGDGVNDSPSLHRADIGIAMGLNGSDVAKSASDIILSDDNFASILNAVEEGRRIFDNIQKFMLHVLALNVGFVIALLVGLVYKDGENISIFQVTPIEILFMLLVAGAFTETGLAFETASPDILNRPPQSVSSTPVKRNLCVSQHADPSRHSSRPVSSHPSSSSTSSSTAPSWPFPSSPPSSPCSLDSSTAASVANAT